MVLLDISSIPDAVANSSATLGIIDIATSIRHSMASSGGKAIASASVVIACLLGVFNLIKASVDIIRGAESGMWSIFRPFIYICIVWGFEWVALSPIDYICNTVDRSLSVAAQGSANTNYNTRKKIFDAVAQEKATANAEKTNSQNNGFGSKGSVGENGISLSGGNDKSLSYVDEKTLDQDRSWMGEFFHQAGQWISNALAKFCGAAINGLLEFLTVLVDLTFVLSCTIYKVAAQFVLCIMAIFGRFLFALAVLRPLDKTWQWVSKYIEVNMWIPMISIIYLFYEKLVAFVSTSPVGTAATGWDAVAEQCTWCVVSALAALAALATLTQVKSMCATVMAGGAAGLGLAAGAKTVAGTVQAGRKVLDKILPTSNGNGGGGGSTATTGSSGSSIPSGSSGAQSTPSGGGQN